MADTIPFNKEDYLQEMRERVTFAFEDSDVFDRFLQLMSIEIEELQEVFRQLIQDRSIDTAKGAQLDIIGNIVGQPRTLVNAENLPFFGFLGQNRAESYGDENIPKVGGYWWDENIPQRGDVILEDTQYRIFIKAKIIKNITRATPEDVIHFITFVFGANVVNITEDSYGHATILIDDSLNNLELSLLDYFLNEGDYLSYFIPKTLGVKYEIGTLAAGQYFGYLGAPNVLGYGVYDPVEDKGVDGGAYASLGL